MQEPLAYFHSIYSRGTLVLYIQSIIYAVSWQNELNPRYAVQYVGTLNVFSKFLIEVFSKSSIIKGFLFLVEYLESDVRGQRSL